MQKEGRERTAPIIDGRRGIWRLLPPAMAEQGRRWGLMAAAADEAEGGNGKPSLRGSLWPRLNSLRASGWRWGLLPPWQRRCERREEGDQPPWKDEEGAPLDERDRRLPDPLTASVARARAHEGEPNWLGRLHRKTEKETVIFSI